MQLKNQLYYASYVAWCSTESTVHNVFRPLQKPFIESEQHLKYKLTLFHSSEMLINMRIVYRGLVFQGEGFNWILEQLGVICLSLFTMKETNYGLDPAELQLQHFHTKHFSNAKCYSRTDTILLCLLRSISMNSLLCLYFFMKRPIMSTLSCLENECQNESIANQLNHLLQLSAMHAAASLLYPVFPWGHLGHLFWPRREITLDTTFHSEWWVQRHNFINWYYTVHLGFSLL